VNWLIKGTSILREQNKRKALSFIRHLGKTSRQDLVTLMNVSKNTVSLIVDELITEGVLEEVGVIEPGKKGRPKIIIKLRDAGFKSLGLSSSKTSLECSVTKYNGEVLEEKAYTIDGTNSGQTVGKLRDIVNFFIQKYDQIIGIGIGIPGIIDSNKNIIHSSTHLGWLNVSLHDLIKDVSIPVYVQNSVNMGAISALNAEGSHGESSSFYVRIREGVGGAFVLDNMMMNGASWTAGEIGHISIDSQGKRCECGQRGCLESLINHDAFIKDAKLSNNDPFIRNGNIKFDYTLLHSSEIKNIIYRYGIHLGKALVQVTHLMNPNQIVIDAPYNIYEEFQQGCLEFLREHALKIPFKQTDIIFGHKRYNMSRGAALSAIINYEKELV